MGITTDISEAATARGPRLKADVGVAYAQCVLRAGGVPLFLPALPEAIADHLAICDAFVFTGGDDPRTEEFGHPTDPRTTPLHPQRQAYEVALLRALENQPQKPVLGVCLGMQLMSLVAGGVLDQYMPDSRPDAGRHWDQEHDVIPVGSHGTPQGCTASGGTASGGTALQSRAGLQIPEGHHSGAGCHSKNIERALSGRVLSKHKQAVIDPGRLQVLAVSDDGVIEAVGDPSRPFYVGVQWHPERTPDQAVGQSIFDAMSSLLQGRS